MNQHFFTALFRNPMQIGAVAPSSPHLAQAMAAQIDPGCKTILELGAGTGAITEGLLNSGLLPQQVVLVEKDGNLAKALGHRFPGIKVIPGDATHLQEILQRISINQVDIVISSLPLLCMSVPVRTQILQQIFALLGPGHKLVQYTYSPAPPIPSQLATELGITGKRVARIYRNLPPASIWVYTHRLNAPS